jgi:hypothetical protein
VRTWIAAPRKVHSVPNIKIYLDRLRDSGISFVSIIVGWIICYAKQILSILVKGTRKQDQPLENGVSLPTLQKNGTRNGKVIGILVNCTGEGQYRNSIDVAVGIWRFHRNTDINA